MSQQFIINGGKKISGEIKVNGAKNFILKALSAALLTKEKCTIRGVPEIADVLIMKDIIQKIGCKVKVKKDQIGEAYEIEAKKIDQSKLNKEDAKKLRASIVFSGSILPRTGEFNIPHPGGDLIGKRPINFFLEGYKKMGAKITVSQEGFYNIKTRGRLKAAKIFFPKISVTGTETLAMAASLAQGITILENVAIEPEVIHLLTCLKKMGAKISGLGTSTLTIEGVEELKGAEFEFLPDRLEAGTFVMMGVMNNASLTVRNCIPSHLTALLERLNRAGANLKIGKDWISTQPYKKRLKALDIQTHEYPGFATDLQPIYTLLMTQAEGSCMIHESIFESRLFFTDTLNRMGADIIMCDPHRVVIKGPTRLHPRVIESPDIRAGITLVLASIMASGQSTIENIQVIDRGYEKIEKRLRKIGVDIKRVKA
ncbi:MAG: UDP-N-acetylglucosamine 1-carboxyvinyltransferase [Candidatus Moranbacteria bacterium]|nr:UDP-N-acetylglucosamine 1-carboxyvinyltransferase [Candidatus Moranbacteria bacterium]